MMRLLWNKFAWRNWLTSTIGNQAGPGSNPNTLLIDGDPLLIDGATVETN